MQLLHFIVIGVWFTCHFGQSETICSGDESADIQLCKNSCILEFSDTSDNVTDENEIFDLSSKSQLNNEQERVFDKTKTFNLVEQGILFVASILLPLILDLPPPMSLS